MTTTDENSNWAAQPTRAVATLAWPIAASFLSYSCMSLVDTLFVGQLGASALAGVGLGGLLAFTLLCFSIGLLRGTKILVSQAVGAEQHHRLPHYLGAALAMAWVLGLVTIGLGQIVAAAIGPFAATPEAGRIASDYLSIRLWASPCVLSYVALREWRYGQGDTRSPMVATVAANGLNIVLDYVFIFGLDLGAPGAAAASALAQTAEAALLGWAVLGRGGRRLLGGLSLIGQLWRVGWPQALQFLVEVGSFATMALIISSMSEVEMAAHQITVHVLHLSFLPAYAIAEAGSVLVGRAVGAGRYEWVVVVAKSALALASAYTALCSLLLLALAPALAAVFSTDASVAAATVTLLYFGAAFQVIDAAAMVGGGLLRGAGDVRFPAMVSVVAAWLCTPTLCWLLGVRGGLGALGGWIGLALELTLIASIFWLRFGFGGWRWAADATRSMVSETS